MKYHSLGTTDIDVSVICLGTMTFGQQNSEAEAHQQLDFALEHGINFIDTAELYPVPPQQPTQGRTEEHIGSWLAKRHNRDHIVLATKAVGPGDWVSYIRNGPRLNLQHIQTALESSLKRLQTDYIDLYQIHWPERATNFFGKLGFTPSEDDNNDVTILETLQALGKLVDEGKIRYIGVSNETPWGVMQYLQLADEYSLPRIVSIQNPYNLLNRSYEVGLAEISYREKAGLLAYSPLGFGVLTGKYLHGAQPVDARLTLWDRFSRYTNRQGLTATQEYVELAHAYGLSPTQMALTYVNTRPFLTSTIIGATSMQQLKENIASIDVTLSADVLDAIEQIHTRYPNPCP